MRCKLVGVSSPKRDRPQRRRSSAAFTELRQSVKRDRAHWERNDCKRRLTREHLLHCSDNLGARHFALHLLTRLSVGLAVLA